MKRTKLTIAIVTTMLAAAFALTVSAGERHHRGNRGGDGEGRMGKMAEKLNLTDKQKAEMKKIADSNKKNDMANRDKLKDLQKKMHAAWGVENPNKTEIIALHKQINTLKGKIGESRINTRFEMAKVLTTEQKKKAAALKAERKDRKADRGEKGKRGERGQRGEKGPGADNGQFSGNGNHGQHYACNNNGEKQNKGKKGNRGNRQSKQKVEKM
ncbi:MAG: Spy/CpxP family protein refolding chaperone [Deltaproteobacteria bacterium]|nr:Spy/CpxP family protein refolding chaperone [Deltaproteobacteria bacterium]